MRYKKGIIIIFFWIHLYGAQPYNTLISPQIPNNLDFSQKDTWRLLCSLPVDIQKEITGFLYKIVVDDAKSHFYKVLDKYIVENDYKEFSDPTLEFQYDYSDVMNVFTKWNEQHTYFVKAVCEKPYTGIFNSWITSYSLKAYSAVYPSNDFTLLLYDLPCYKKNILFLHFDNMIIRAYYQNSIFKGGGSLVQEWDLEKGQKILQNLTWVQLASIHMWWLNTHNSSKMHPIEQEVYATLPDILKKLFQPYFINKRNKGNLLIPELKKILGID